MIDIGGHHDWCNKMSRIREILDMYNVIFTLTDWHFHMPWANRKLKPRPTCLTDGRAFQEPRDLHFPV